VGGGQGARPQHLPLLAGQQAEHAQLKQQRRRRLRQLLRSWLLLRRAVRSLLLPRAAGAAGWRGCCRLARAAIAPAQRGRARRQAAREPPPARRHRHAQRAAQHHAVQLQGGGGALQGELRGSCCAGPRAQPHQAWHFCCLDRRLACG
jgi:hypothetical protein